VVVGVIWTIIWSVYYLAYARRRFRHGGEWRSQEDAVAAEASARASAGTDTAEPLPDPST
jgi:hypothetical protein